jgi:hypothetical protein
LVALHYATRYERITAESYTRPPVRVVNGFSPRFSPRKAKYIKGVSPKVRVVSVVSDYLL